MANFGPDKIAGIYPQFADFEMNTHFDILSQPEVFLKEFFEKKHFSSVFVVTDTHSKRFCLPLVKGGFPPDTTFISLPAGEHHKNLDSCQAIWKVFTKKNADRKALLINLGGGVIGDLGGFSASVYKRGIAFAQFPTTLLAMVDASIGGKTGIDFLDFKNQIGAFSSPEGVWIFPDFLKTLPESELISGFAEVIKHALIADLKGWQVFRKKELHDQNWPQLISESLKVKAQIVENDPFEKGERQKLNAGHTLGHALESLQMAKGKPIPHGFCVAAGLVMESRISLEKGWLPEKELLEIEELTFTIFGKMEFDKGEIKRILKYTQQDKKNEKGRVKAALIGPIGNCQTGVEITESDMEMALKYYLLGE